MKKKASEQGKGAQRRPEDYMGLSRSVASNHFRSELTKSSTRNPRFVISDFFSSRSFTWIYYYIQSRLGFRHPYTSQYDKTDNGVYEMSDDNSVRICIAGDWATYTTQSIAIADRMRSMKPHFTIHLGDTYYVGAPHEIRNNFTKKGAPWPRGSLGSFALLGNHEMYARGIAFYDQLLPSMGLKNAGNTGKQKAPFFCLQNKYWRILGLDTGYHSIGSLPILEMVSWFTPECRFDQKMMDWLKETVRLDDPEDKRALMILTHHQYISAFRHDSEYTMPAQQLASLIGKNRPVVWLWGHEHKFSVYEKSQVGKGITAYGRCIGHGGMPIELKSKEFMLDKTKVGFDKLVMVDQRQDPKAGEQYTLGYNGFVMVNLNGRSLEIQYHDAHEQIFSEQWEPTTQGGVKGTIKPPNAIIGTQVIPGKSWGDAIK